MKTKVFIRLEQSLEYRQKTIDKRLNIAQTILCHVRILRGPAVNDMQISQKIIKTITRHDLLMNLATDAASGSSRHCDGNSNMPTSNGINAATSSDDSSNRSCRTTCCASCGSQPIAHFCLNGRRHSCNTISNKKFFSLQISMSENRVLDILKNL